MGTHNRERRRAKQAARTRSQHRRTAAGGPTAGRVTEPGEKSAGRLDIEWLIAAAAHADCSGDDPAWAHRTLVAADFGADGRQLVASELERSISEGLRRVLLTGWEPADVWHVARRGGDARQAAVAAALMGAVVEGTFAGDRLARRLEQCDALDQRRRVDPSGADWEGDVTSALSLVNLLDHLGPLERLDDLGAGASAARRSGARHVHADVSPLLARIRSLLAMAESTDFAEEADAFTAKATELMQRHRIDMAAVEAIRGIASESDVAGRRCWVDAPYAAAKSLLLHVVATESACRAVWDERGFMTIVGERDDLDVVELLFTSLLVQATQQMTAVGRVSPEDEDNVKRHAEAVLAELGPSATEALGGTDAARQALVEHLSGRRSKVRRSQPYRKAFLTAYANRIGTRLREAREATTTAAACELGGAFLPVLARRRKAVDDAIDRCFGKLVPRAVKITDAAGWAAGTAAADLANLNVREELRMG